MTEGEQEDRASVGVFPPGVPLATILLGVGLQRLWPIGFSMPVPARYWVGGAVVLSAFLGLGLWSVILFRHSGQDVNPRKPSPQIVDRGPFRFTRNPMYLQMVLVCAGFAVILSNVWILLLTPVCALVLQSLAILPEEAYLERKFGEEYRRYKRRVRRWL